ncbi:MAG: hypothetical protein K2Q18_02580 [Bdellovibrionales bacterium]|nr:hypothetical protein [Bdellovibrionales bacterium]
MKKNSVLVKTFACLFSATLVLGSYVQTSERFEPKKVDFSAFKNASANIQFLSEKPVLTEASGPSDVTGRIVKTIESEVKRKIYSTRIAIKPVRLQNTALANVVKKNWNDIKPEFAAVDLKINTPETVTLTLNEEASEFEINNKELINLYKFETGALAYESFANVDLASYELEVTPASTQKEIASSIEAPLNDEVNIAQSSTTTKIIEEITPEAAPALPTEAELEDAKIATTENSINDELVVYDYSENNVKAEAPKVLSKKMFDAPISNSVKEAIAREVHKTSPTIVSTQAAKKSFVPDNNDEDKIDLEKVMADADTIVNDYTSNKQASNAKAAEVKAISAFAAGFAPDVTTQMEYTITAKEINLSTQKVREISNYEFVPDYDRSERLNEVSGTIKIGYSLSNEVSTQTGVLEAVGMIPTRVELNLKNGGIEIPLLNEASIQKFLQKKGLDIFGNLFMTAVDSSIDDVEIDSDYQAKLYFTEKFKLVESMDAASYVLFLGVKNGNMLVRYLLDNKETAQKIVYVGEGEMYFEDPDFVDSARELYTFNTRTLLGRKAKELNIDGSDITVFGTKITSKKKTLNSYEIKIPEMVENSRKYLEFKHMGSSLFVGTTNTKEIEIPGLDFIGRVLQSHQLSELGERCMVQLNLSKDLRDIKVNGKNRSGEMFVESSFLDNDGNFSRDNSELAEKVFITGDLEGIFGVRLDYTDGSTEFLKTYCSEGSYLIEQL